MKFILRVLAAAALMVLATDVGQGAPARARATSNKPAAGTTPVEATLARHLAARASKPKVAQRKGPDHTSAARDAQRGGAARGAHKGGVETDAHERGVAAGGAAQKGGGPITPMPVPGAPAVSARGVAPATHIPATRSGPPAFHVTPPPATAAREGAVSGTSIKPHISTLVTLGGAAVTGKGTAHISGTNMRPKTH